MKLFLLYGLGHWVVQPISENKHPKDVETLAVDLSSANSHRRSYAGRELAFLAKMAGMRVQSTDRIESLEAKGELELLHLRAVPACIQAMEKNFVLGSCAEIMRHLNRIDSLEALKAALARNPNFWDTCALNKSIRHLSRQKETAADP